VTLLLQDSLPAVPAALSDYELALSKDGTELTYTYDTRSDTRGIVDFMKHVNDAGIAFKDLRTRQSSLEDIFVSLVEGGRQ
jgi:ABC-2 type transport system ATP-binding protein